MQLSIFGSYSDCINKDNELFFMNIILGHDIVVQYEEGFYWKALKISSILQEQPSEMEICFIHSILGFFLVFKCRAFWYPTIDSSRENKT